MAADMQTKPLQRLSLEKLKLKHGFVKAKALTSLQQRGSVENMKLLSQPLIN